MNISASYQRVGLDYNKVKAVLVELGNEYCHKESKERWSKSR